MYICCVFECFVKLHIVKRRECMKSKILCALLALCLFVSLLPVTVLAADPEVTVTFSNIFKPEDAEKADDPKKVGFSLTVAPGETKYVITNDIKQFEAWTEEEPPADKFVELDYPADGSATLQVTLKNIDSDNSEKSVYNNHSIWFGAGEYAVVIDLVGENKILASSSSCIYHDAKKGMTITGDGSLSTRNTGGVSGSIWTRAGDLLIKDTTLDMTCDQHEENSKYNAILSTYGNVIIEDSEITYSTDGGSLIFMGSSEFMGTDNEGKARTTLDESTDRFITIKDSKITGSATLSTFSSKNPCVIINSTLELKKTASNTEANKAIFYPSPKLEGDYGAWGGTAKKPENAKQYDPADSKLWKASVGYIKLLPGKYELPAPEADKDKENTSTSTSTSSKPSTSTSTSTNSKPSTSTSTSTNSKPSTSTSTSTTSKPSTSTSTTSKPSTSTSTTPETTAPEVTTPETTAPKATTPETTAPKATTPETTAPEATNPAEDNNKKSGNGLKIVLIVIISLVVAAGAALGVILYLQKKKAK